MIHFFVRDYFKELLLSNCAMQVGCLNELPEEQSSTGLCIESAEHFLCFMSAVSR